MNLQGDGDGAHDEQGDADVPAAGASPAVRAVCRALLPSLAQPEPRLCGPEHTAWRLYEVMRTATQARVAVEHSCPHAATGAAVAGRAVLCWVVDLLWEEHPFIGDASPRAASGARGAWLLTHVEDTRHRLSWDVYGVPGGTAWRMQPRYDPQWLRERERMVMARLRGALPLVADDPVAVAGADAPVWLEPLAGVVQERGNDRERATVVFAASPQAQLRRADCYTVRLRWRRLSLRPYRSVGFWLVDGLWCTQGGG